MKRSGFTLIELLIVVAIIAVLISILAPALQNARNHARSAMCLSHLNQWGKTWIFYLEENKNKFPSGRNIDLVSSGSWYRGDWITALQDEWQKKPGMLMCPKAKEPIPNPDNPGEYAKYGGPFNSYRMKEEWEHYRCSYGLNLWMYSVSSDLQNRKAEYHWKRIDKISFPSEVPLFLDSMWRGGGPHYGRGQAYAAPIYNGEWSGASREMKHFAIDRHSGFVNCLYADTSARKVGIKGLWGLRWHEKFNVGYINILEQSGGWTWPAWFDGLPE